jgi:hypothetical protein
MAYPVVPSAALCLETAERKTRGTASISKLHMSAHSVQRNQLFM